MMTIYPLEIAHLCQIRDRMLASGDSNPHRWRELAKRFLHMGAIANAKKCLERAEYFSNFRAKSIADIFGDIN